MPTLPVVPKAHPVKVPRELHGVRASALEEYVRARIGQFMADLTPRLQDLAASLSTEDVNRAVADALQALPPPDYGQVPLENMELQLVFRHDCLALGCLDSQCVLCQHNSNRRCSVNFDRKYLVNDVLKAKCGAIIRVELVDKGTGMVVEEAIPDLKIEMVMLDGNMYDTKFLESGRTLDSTPDADRELESCMLLMNNKSQPLLMCGPGGINEPSGKVVLQLQRGKAVIPEIHVTDSSEALLSGRKPPYRLLVKASYRGEGNRLNIRHAVSEGFVVATRRTRTAGKADIPSMDDHVSKLEHMGKETVKKLQDIQGAAIQCGIDINIPENCVQKVGDFKQLSMRAEQDGHLRQKLQHVLKLSKEKWDEARDHAMKAVVADNRMRAWYADRGSMDVGLLFICRLGNVDLERPIGLLQHKTENGEPKIECTLMAQQTPSQREMVRTLNPQAAHNWWLAGHPGWAIFPMDSEMFLQTGQLMAPNSTQAASPEGPPPSGYPPSPSLKPQTRSISPPAHIPARIPAKSLPHGQVLTDLLGGLSEDTLLKLAGGGSTSPFTQGLAGLHFPAGPTSPSNMSPTSETTSMAQTVPSPRMPLSNNLNNLGRDYAAGLSDNQLDHLERVNIKRKKDSSAQEADTLSNYHHSAHHNPPIPRRSFSNPPENHSPRHLTPPGSPLHVAPLPTPFRPPDSLENNNFRPPLLTPLPGGVGLSHAYHHHQNHHQGHHHAAAYGNMSSMPQGPFPPTDFRIESLTLPNEVSLTPVGLPGFPTPSFDLDRSLELPENWKQFELPDGSLALPANTAGWQVLRANSGLETMQSIEEALPHFDHR